MAASERVTDKRVCLLTGASGTLGTTFCRLFAARYDIAAVYRTREPSVASQLRSVVDPLTPHAALPDNANPVFAVRADLSADGQIERVVELTLARFGRVDLLVNAAACSRWGDILESRDLLDSVPDQLRTNVEVPLRLAAEVAKRFWRDRDVENRRRNRNVINVSSIAGLCVYPGTGQSVYSASKAALNMLTCHMAHDFGSFGVRVNAVAPNSFPGRVATRSVTSALRELDASTKSGTIVVLDSDRVWSWTPDADSMRRLQGSTATRRR